MRIKGGGSWWNACVAEHGRAYLSHSIDISYDPAGKEGCGELDHLKLRMGLFAKEGRTPEQLIGDSTTIP